MEFLSSLGQDSILMVVRYSLNTDHADVDKSKGKRMPRRYSRLRVEAFNRYAIKVFQELLADQIQIWDVAALGEAFSPPLKKRVAQCVSNHMFRSGIDLENQLLFNMLCPTKDI